MRLTMTIIGVICAMSFGLIAGYSHVLVIGIFVAGGGLLLQVIADVLSIPLQADLRLARLAAVDITRRLTGLLLIGALALFGASLLSFLAVSIASGTVAVLLLAWLVRAQVTLRVNLHWRKWRALFADSLPFAVAASIGALYFYVTIVVMSLIASAVQTGYFATSFRVVQVALALPVIALTAIFPLIAQRGSDQELGVGLMMGKVVNVAVIFGVWMSLALAVGAHVIIDVVAGTSGHRAIPVLRIQGLVLTASFVSVSCMLGLLALRRYRPMLIATSAALVLNVALGLLLIPTLGARGGAIADVATETMVAAGLTVALIRALPRRELSAVVVPSVILAVATATAVLLLPLGTILQVILATIVYFGILLIAGTIPDEMINAARSLRTIRIHPASPSSRDA
jgi:O-antigen/teichoic acid export membrane protein